MNVRKPTDYSAMFAALDELMVVNLPQMELYHGIGRIVSDRPEKGAAVAAAEYLHNACPDATGFSPRNLRRMRDFYCTYENAPEVMSEAMAIGWTQNIVIMEAELTILEKVWYIRAVRKFGWSKLELVKQIAASAHLEISLDFGSEVCCTGKNSNSECANNDVASPQPDGRACDEGLGKESQAGESFSHRIRLQQHEGDRQPNLSPGEVQVGGAWHQLYRKNDVTTHSLRLQQIWSPDRGEPDQHTEYVPYLRRRCRRQDAFDDELLPTMPAMWQICGRRMILRPFGGMCRRTVPVTFKSGEKYAEQLQQVS